MSRLDKCYNIADLREAARKRLPRGLFEFVDRGVEDEVALANNLDSFRRLKLWIKVLVDIDAVDLGTDLLGAKVAMPLAISPTGLAGLCWHEGELALAKAAAAAGIPYTLANGSITAMEKIAKEAGGRLWFQIYMWRERELTYKTVRRAADAGFETLVVTVDTGFGGNREYNKRNGFGVPFEFTRKNIPDFILHPGWVERVVLRYMLTSGFPRHWNYPAGYESILAKDGKGKGRTMRGENATWQDIDKLRALWPGKLLVKGILHPDDAQRAIEHGADGVVISNHGGRSLDGAPAPLDVLPAIVDAVGSRTTIILDSGIRRGSDIAKALALGAKAVMIGRATLYGIAVGGESGATHALSLLQKEFRQTMGYVGCLSVDQISRDILVSPRGATIFDKRHIGDGRMTGETGAMDRIDERAVADFYKNHAITLYVGSAPGGGYAVYAETLARHLPRHMPGEPAVAVEYRGEKAGFCLTRELANTMPRDGSVIGAIRSANTVESVLNPSPDVNFDVRDFNWIGSVSRQNGTIITWHTSDLKSLADVRRRPVVAGAESPYSNVGTLPNILNGLLGTRFITRSDFDRKGLERAFESGTVECICGLGYNTLLAAHSDWLDGGKLNILAHTGLDRDPLMPGVPCTIEFAKTEDDRNIIRMMDYRQVMGRPYAAPPGVPADRLAALRQAFMTTMKDPAFLADAKKNNMLVDPLSAAGMTQIVADAHKMPAHIVRRTWDLLGGVVD